MKNKKHIKNDLLESIPRNYNYIGIVISILSFLALFYAFSVLFL
jgi:hypothetical protein